MPRTTLHEIYTLLSQIFKGQHKRFGWHKPVPLLVVAIPISAQTDSSEHTFPKNHLITKDNALRNLCQRLWVQLCHHTSSARNPKAQTLHSP
jgi:hypothetical protein